LFEKDSLHPKIDFRDLVLQALFKLNDLQIRKFFLEFLLFFVGFEEGRNEKKKLSKELKPK